MRWHADGPDLPDDLLKEHADGRLVFFVGAGVSRRARLPDFGKLVRKLYRDFGAKKPRGIVSSDQALFHLESAYGAREVRRHLQAKLALGENADTATHLALIRLARTQFDGEVRLVTTNVDQAFVRVAETEDVACDFAPKLPIPRRGEWRSIVHLHGGVGDHDPSGQSLVFTSADFGRAYLSDAWASRLITEMFRNFAVVFVGYSVNDPIMRYFIEGLTAERAQGLTSFAFCENKDCERFKFLGITPLPYETANEHVALHATIRNWAAVHWDGKLGKKLLLQRHFGAAPPVAGAPEIEQVVWALSDADAAEYASRLEPCPPIEWIEHLHRDVFTRENAGNSPEERANRGLRAWALRHLDKLQLVDHLLHLDEPPSASFLAGVRSKLANPDQPLSMQIRKFWELYSSAAAWPGRVLRYGDTSALVGRALEEWNAAVKIDLLFALTPRASFRPSWRFLNNRDVADITVELNVGGREGCDLLDSAFGSSLGHAQILRDVAEEVTQLLRAAMELGQFIDGKPPVAHDLDPFSFVSPDLYFHDQRALLERLALKSWRAVASTAPERAALIAEGWRQLDFPVFARLSTASQTPAVNEEQLPPVGETPADEPHQAEPRPGFLALRERAQRSDWATPKEWDRVVSDSKGDGALAGEVLRMLVVAPDTHLRDDRIAESITWILRRTPNVVVPDDTFWPLVERLLRFEIAKSDEPEPDIHGDAIDSLIYRVVETMISRLLGLVPQPAERDLQRFAPILSASRFEGRCRLVRELDRLYSCGPAWVEERLVPLLGWNTPSQAAHLWRHYRPTPQTPLDLWKKIKPDFLACFKHSEVLGREARVVIEKQARSLFLILFLQQEWIKCDETRAALSGGGSECRDAFSLELRNCMEGLGTAADRSWESTFGPMIRNCWPKEVKYQGPVSSLQLAIAVTYCSSTFEDAVKTVLSVLVPTPHSAGVLERLLKAGHSTKHPAASLSLLDAIVENDGFPVESIKRDLIENLRAIRSVSLDLANDHRFKRLSEYAGGIDNP